MRWTTTSFSRPMGWLPDETLEQVLARHPDVHATTEQRDAPPTPVHTEPDHVSMLVPEGFPFHLQLLAEGWETIQRSVPDDPSKQMNTMVVLVPPVRSS